MTKTGWWSVGLHVKLEGEEIPFDALSETSQEHILKMIADGYRSGEVVEESEDLEDNCENETYDCDSCVRNGDCCQQGIDGQPRFLEFDEDDEEETNHD